MSDPSRKGQGAGLRDTISHDAGGAETGKWFLTLSVRN